jgi:FkbM family methyltransferase
MKKVFIDGGTNLGQGLNQIMKAHEMDSDWEITSFEVNPNTFKYMDKTKFPNVKFINKGLWNENCKRNLMIEIWPDKIEGFHNEFLTDKDLKDLPVGGASHVLEEDWLKPHYIAENLQEYADKNNLDPNNYISYVVGDLLEVECIDLSEFIRENYSKTDHIVMKLDVEGAEYPILEKMIADGTIEYLNEVYIEWHQRLMKTPQNEREIIEKMQSLNIKINGWA